MRFKIVLIFLFISMMMNAQLSSPGASSSRLASYPSSPGKKDPIFFFCNMTGNERGDLVANRPWGTTTYDFKWYQWNGGTNSFSTFLKTDSAVSSSTLDNLLDGGYKVEIDSAGLFDTSLVGWIFFDKQPLAQAYLQQQICDRVALNGDTAATIKRFYYNDILTGSPLSLKNELTFLWSSDPQSIIPYPTFYLLKVIDSPPLEDVTYKLTVNSLGCVNEASFFVKSIKVKADFTVDPDKGEAPLKVTFTDKSVRGFTYKWKFGDDSVSSVKDPGIHTYYRPGDYLPTLIVESDIHCIDSMSYDKISVDPSELNIPNVFTPDGDGLNDNFIVESKSLRTINVEVFSRSGMRVYTFSGEGQALADWTGWNGNVNNSSTKAAPGVYFYVIRATGWDDIVYDGKLFRGFVYLYR